jgi:hypothetical protein
MVRRFAAVLAVAVLGFTAAASAQQQTGEIFGKVTDNTGAILPGVTVTLTGEALIQPQTAITSTSGSYQFPRIPIGTYTVKFELPGFKTMVREGIRVNVGFNADVTQQMEISTVQETVTVTGESPIVDTKQTGAKSTFDLETLQNIPSARDPWVMLERTPAIAMDRVNVGGSQSGQQSGYVSRGTMSTNNKWAIDGVDITDMSATGASPIYYDFDMLQEMQVTTGGADASQQTGGVGINFVTRSGTDRFKGSGRYYVTDDKFEADNLTDDVKRGGVGGGAPIQNIKDYGLEVGGPIARGRVWYWGSIGKQNIKAGIPGFYQPDANCQTIKATLAADPLAPISTNDVRACLGTDGTKLNNYNWKVTASPFRNNKFNFQNTWAEKTKNARNASDTRPIETTVRQMAVEGHGRKGWDTGPSPLWKASDQHVFTDRFLAEVQYAHLGNNFALTFHEDALRDVQPRLETSTNLQQRSADESLFLRPTESVDVTTSYFLPAFLSGDHALRGGFRWRRARGESISHYGGNALARYTNSVSNSADLYRDGWTNYNLNTLAAYLQDTYSKGRLTLNLGVRWDRQQDEALASSVGANPIVPDKLPAIDFPGFDSGVVWDDFSPRLGLTYDLTGGGHTVARASYSMYFGQMSPGQLAQRSISVSQVFVRYPWADNNGDGFVQRDELNLNTILSRSAAYNPADPSNFRSAGQVDPNVKNDRTREAIVGISHELRRDLGIEANYIWRKYDQFAWNDRIGLTSANYVPVNLQPTCTRPDAVCDAITYYQPTFAIPAAFNYTNTPDRWRDYNGVELVLSKRYSSRWMGNASVAYNGGADHWGSPDSYEDPSCVSDSCPLAGSQLFAPESSGSGIDNVFTNSKWLFKASGMYSLPWSFNVSGVYNLRQGYPFPRGILTPNRANQAGQVTVLLDELGSVRQPDVYTLDLKVERQFTFGTARIMPSFEVFNVTNANTVLARRRNQAATNANLISGIVAPRVARFGLRVQW